MNELVVEAGKFDSNDTDLDRSLERQQLMKELLTADFTENSSGQDGSQDEIASQSTSDVGDVNDKEDAEENLNEMLSTNNEDYELYHQIDEMWASTGVKKGLFEDDQSIPDWIRFPKGRKQSMTTNQIVLSGGREKKKVLYDDGLTEKQFLKLMENGVPEEKAPDVEKTPAVAPEVMPTTNSASNDFFTQLAPKVSSSRSRKNQDIPPDALPHEIINKLINTTKAIIYYKEAQTKRRLAEVFLERPSPQMYPDYYQVIKEPIGMNDILRKCRARLFTDVKQWFDDWRLLFSNARKYNPEVSRSFTYSSITLLTMIFT